MHKVQLLVYNVYSLIIPTLIQYDIRGEKSNFHMRISVILITDTKNSNNQIAPVHVHARTHKDI